MMIPPHGKGASMVNIAIVGYGNLGHGVHAAIRKNPDMKLAAVFSRRPDKVKKDIKGAPVLDSNKLSIPGGLRIDVAVLCGGSKDDTPVQGPLFIDRFSTVDSFDTHADIPRYFKKMNAIAKKRGHVAVMSAGWDPGIFSLERVLGDAFLPGGKGYTFWGPGVSQGHSDAARRVKGVLDARQYTHPIEGTLEKVREGTMSDFTKRQMHKRIVFVVADRDADKTRIRRDIASMANYYADYNTEVNFITAAEMAKNHSAYPHGGFVLTSGKTGKGNMEIVEYRCQLSSNPEFTGSVLIACARAAWRMNKTGWSGAYTMLDIPPAFFSPHSPEELRHDFM
jgi:diaminopimelate dehydrogenase